MASPLNSNETKTQKQEDDLEDLDGLLDQFDVKKQEQEQIQKKDNKESLLQESTAATTNTTNDATTSSSKSKSTTLQETKEEGATGKEEGANEDDEDEDEFTKNLVKEMEKLLSLDASTKGAASSGVDKDDENAFMQEIQNSLKNLLQQVDPENNNNNNNKDNPSKDSTTDQPQANSTTTSTSTSTNKAATSDFQEQILKTMNRMKDGSDKMTADQNSTNPDLTENGNDPASGFESLLQSFGQEEDLQEALDGFMKMLMTRDVLYEPMRELRDKFPDWIEKNKDSLSSDDLKLRNDQFNCVKEIVNIFDQDGFDPENSDCQKRLSKAVEQMQEYGPPPEEIMGPVPEGMDLDKDGMPKMDPENCIIS